MEHKCTVPNQEIDFSKYKWYQRYLLMSPDNPLRFNYFSSDVTVREEHKRHLKVSKYTIHPFSRFRAWYEVYLIYLYASLLITKPLDAGFVKSENCGQMSLYMYYNIFTDFLSWVDIIINFHTGYEQKQLNRIELRKKYIAKKYILSSYFITDALSSLPKCILFSIQSENWNLKAFGVWSFLGLFKAVRIVSFVKYMWRAADYFHVTHKGAVFLACTMFGSLMIIHWLACMQFAIPHLIRYNFATGSDNQSWYHLSDVYDHTLSKQSLLIRYNHCLFKSSAYVLAIRVILYELETPEEYVLAICTYFIGKILVGFLWIIIAMTILNSRIMQLKFAEIMNELHEYMNQKQLSPSLRNRITQHFSYKYRNKYFQEDYIVNMLSENLRREANLHSCKTVIENVPLFKELSKSEISKVVNCLIAEIFMPNDAIIHAGTQGNDMYFLASGTVAVYTRSGREICHLQDGAYFGEIALVMGRTLRYNTIVALEKTHVYRLNKKDFLRFLLMNDMIRSKIMTNAETRLKESTRLEEEYKEILLERSLKTISKDTLKKKR